MKQIFSIVSDQSLIINATSLPLCLSYCEGSSWIHCISCIVKGKLMDHKSKTFGPQHCSSCLSFLLICILMDLEIIIRTWWNKSKEFLFGHSLLYIQRLNCFLSCFLFVFCSFHVSFNWTAISLLRNFLMSAFCDDVTYCQSLLCFITFLVQWEIVCSFTALVMIVTWVALFILQNLCKFFLVHT